MSGRHISSYLRGPFLCVAYYWSWLDLNSRASSLTLAWADYIVQKTRFQVDAGFGCGNHYDVTGMAILLLEGWKILFPLIAVCCYCCEPLFFLS
jgi:hypothetical protein